MLFHPRTENKWDSCFVSVKPGAEHIIVWDFSIYFLLNQKRISTLRLKSNIQTSAIRMDGVLHANNSYIYIHKTSVLALLHNNPWEKKCFYIHNFWKKFLSHINNHQKKNWFEQCLIGQSESIKLWNRKLQKSTKHVEKLKTVDLSYIIHFLAQNFSKLTFLWLSNGHVLFLSYLKNILLRKI